MTRSALIRDDLPYWPAALRLDQAAAYVGLSEPTFKKVCPVKPVKFTQSTRGQRYLRDRLDNWLADLDPNGPLSPKPVRRFGDNLDGGKSAA